MKEEIYEKIICFLSFLGIALASGCEYNSLSSLDSSINEVGSQNNITYNAVSISYKTYETAKELVDASNVIVSGKVTGLDFGVMDTNNNQIATDKTAPHDKEIYTIYTIEVISHYKYIKDEVPVKLNLWIEGGFKDRYVEEQIEALGGSGAITISFTRPEIEVGETYLFSLQTKNGIDAYVMNAEQSIINMSNLQNTDQFGWFTAKDIIDCFE